MCFLATESARLVRDIGVKSPALITQLAQLPADVVQAAIATARRCPSTRDLGAVVGRMLRDFLEHGTLIPDPVRPANAPTTAADIRASFARLGYELHEDPLDELNLTEDDLAAVEAQMAIEAAGAGLVIVPDDSGTPGAPIPPQELSVRLRDELSLPHS